MSSRNKRVSSLVTLVASVAVLAGLLMTHADKGRSAGNFSSKNLVGASTETINQYAIDYTLANYVVDSPSTIRLSKSVTAQEATDLGIGVGNPTELPRSYHLVILEGDFTRPATGIHAKERYRFIAYVLDLEAGVPTTIIDSLDGSAVKQALGDATLPDETVPVFATPNPEVLKQAPISSGSPEPEAPTDQPLPTPVIGAP